MTTKRSVQIKIGNEIIRLPLGQTGTDFRGLIANQIKKNLEQTLVDKSQKVSALRLRQVALAMTSAGNAEFSVWAPYVKRTFFGVQNTPAHQVNFRFNFGSGATEPLKPFIVPSAQRNLRKSISETSATLTWTALRKKYWEGKGKQPFFKNTGQLMQSLQSQLDQVPARIGNIKVVYDPETRSGQKTVRNKYLLGYFRISFLKPQFFSSVLFPGLNPASLPTQLDPYMDLERVLFQGNKEILKKLGVDAQKFTPRQFIQPTLGWWLLDRIPAAMARAGKAALESFR